MGSYEHIGCCEQSELLPRRCGHALHNAGDAETRLKPPSVGDLQGAAIGVSARVEHDSRATFALAIVACRAGLAVISTLTSLHAPILAAVSSKSEAG